jgi:signal transduction histidine kinase
VGERIMPDPGYGMYQVRQTGCSARFDTDDPSGADMPHFVRLLGIRSVVASPIVVEGKLWGAVTTVSLDRPLGPRVEHRLNEFTGLVATAVANTQSREHVAALAEQQAALRRVATLVAQGTTPAELFSAVAEEVANVMGIPVVALDRYEGDGTFTIVGIAGETVFTVGDRYQVVEDGVSGMILAARSPVRVEDYSGLCGPLGDALREDSMTSTLGVPVVVDGRIWGFLVAGGRPGRPIPTGTEERLAEFTELIATAVSNATTRSELLESRARLVSAADETRRRIERDLHDGIQQRLIRLAFALRTSERQLPEEPPELRKSLASAAVELSDAIVEVREISRGIHPAVLTQGGLGPALRTLARRSPCPVQVIAGGEIRLPEHVEVAAYYVVAEALANVAKHAHATLALVDFNVTDGVLTLQVQDDGVGGADARRGSGLIGIADRVQALGGTFEVESPADVGTTLLARLPASDEQTAPLADGNG